MRDLTTKRCCCLLSMLAPFFALGLSGCYEKEDTNVEIPPVPVVLATVEKRDVQLYIKFTGKTHTDPVDIVPRVRGYIESVNFEPGDIVKQGDILYEIEKFDYQNKLDVAIANRDVAQARVEKCKADYERDQALQKQGQGFTTQADLDRDKALYDEAKGLLAESEAKIALAQKELDRCTIKATDTGLISRTLIAQGNMVDGTSGADTLLTSIAPMNPMYVYCQLPDSLFNAFHARVRQTFHELLGEDFDVTRPYDNKMLSQIAEDHGLEKTIAFSMGLRDDKDENGNQNYPFSGTIDFTDNHVDMATGTITIRGKLDNSDYSIYPGNICNVRIPGKKIPGAILIEEAAVCYDLSNAYVWVIDAGGKPMRQTVKLGEQYEQKYRIIESGLQGGEKYVLDGTLKVSEGCSITEQVPTIDSQSPQTTEKEQSDAPADAQAQ